LSKGTEKVIATPGLNVIVENCSGSPGKLLKELTKGDTLMDAC
jgi:hypothetical protein